MQQNQWLVERLNEVHKQELMKQAENARQAQFALQVSSASQPSNLLQKLRSDLMNLANKSQESVKDSNR